MGQPCFICNRGVGSSQKLLCYFLQESSEKPSASTVSDILDNNITEKELESKSVCQKCRDSCLEYEKLSQRLKTIKDDLVSKFKETLSHNGLPTIKATAPGDANTANNTVKTPTKRVVLPASKLHPVPAEYVLKKFPKISTLTPLTQGINLKTPVVSSAINSNQPLSDSDDVTLTKIFTTDASDRSNNLVLTTTASDAKLMNTATNSFGLDVNLVGTKEVLTPDVMKEEVNDEENNDEQEMEIDEDCSVRVVKENPNSNTGDVKEDDNVEGSNEAEFGEELVLGELEVMSDNGQDDDEGSLVVSESGSGAKVHVMSGHKLVYSAEELSLIDNDGPDENNESNDESQIELQVSGDEETANAIIQAAQEQGGAFIKVETGEMFRVKSVHSAELKADIDRAHKIVEKVGGKFKCLLCVAKSDVSISREAESIMRHMREQHAARVYICCTCGEIMYRRQLYTAHLAQHRELNAPGAKVVNSRSGSGIHRCGICGKTFASKYTHLAHLKTHQERSRPFKCETCSKAFLTVQNLNQHLKIHLGVKDFVCNICGKAFGSQHNLEMHAVVHSGQKPFACTMCPKRFARRAELQDHTRTHTGERPFECGECGARFAQRSNLHSHRRAAHLQDARHACQQCPKKFKRRRLLEYHVKSCHTGERPLRCELCHATFVYPEHYKKHLRIHSGERPYTCEVCGKAFNSRDIRNTHRFVHSDKKPYECLVCGAGFMRRPLLYAHMNSAGHLAESIVVNQPRVQKVLEEDLNTEEPTIEIKTNKLDAMFESAQEVELITAEVTSDGKTSSIHFVDETGGDIDSIVKATDVNTVLQSISVQELGDRAQVIYTEGDQASVTTTTEGGKLVRMVPIKLDNGNTGWLAITE